jgi:hypothetical protein
MDASQIPHKRRKSRRPVGHFGKNDMASEEVKMKKGTNSKKKSRISKHTTKQMVVNNDTLNQLQPLDELNIVPQFSNQIDNSNRVSLMQASIGIQK